MAAPVAPDQRSHITQRLPYTFRITRDGRKLWYRLNILQQPERARACGSGPKSTTDRRPVDPPPIVEFRMFEGDSIEAGEDVTFKHNANFFLYATLEHARPVANGRVNTPAATSPPVLTGLPVSGMAYLDRPNVAGYFLFPDLSVRHEGRYKFVFNLYEQTKEERDKDPDASDLESFDHRLQIESGAFSVFSAKKFPGLAESTHLSRTIQEQGCRVRIRRDVRMRRRPDGKPSGGTNYQSRKEEFEHAQHNTNPEISPDSYRARSASNSSVDRNPYPDVYNRSLSEYRQPPAPQPYAASPGTPNNASSHIYFGQPPGPQCPPPLHPTGQAPHQHPLASPVPSNLLDPASRPPSRTYSQSQPTQYPVVQSPGRFSAPQMSPTSTTPISRFTDKPSPKTQNDSDPGASNNDKDSGRRTSALKIADICSLPEVPTASKAASSPPVSGRQTPVPLDNHSYPLPPDRRPSPFAVYQSPVQEYRSPVQDYRPCAQEYRPAVQSYRPVIQDPPRSRIEPSRLPAQDQSPKDHMATLPPIIPPDPQPVLVANDQFVESRPVQDSKKRPWIDSFPDDGIHQRLTNGDRQSDPHMNPQRSQLHGFDEPWHSKQTFPRADGRMSTALIESQRR